MATINNADAHLEATITFLRTEQGGRKSPVLSGYRGQFDDGGEDWDAIQTYSGVERVNPGDTVTVA